MALEDLETRAHRALDFYECCRLRVLAAHIRNAAERYEGLSGPDAARRIAASLDNAAAINERAVVDAVEAEAADAAP